MKSRQHLKFYFDVLVHNINSSYANGRMVHLISNTDFKVESTICDFKFYNNLCTRAAFQESRSRGAKKHGRPFQFLAQF